jgi:hypothetical protein
MFECEIGIDVGMIDKLCSFDGEIDVRILYGLFVCVCVCVTVIRWNVHIGVDVNEDDVVVYVYVLRQSPP